MPKVTTVDADYTAKDGIGTLTVATDDADVARDLREAFFQIQEALQRGGDFHLLVEVAA